jgi:hypothetical protein
MTSAFEADHAPSTPALAPRSRRAILGGALAGIGALVAKAAVLPAAVRAAGDDGTAITIGGTYGDVQGQTTLGNKANDGVVFYSASNNDSGHGNGIGLWGVAAGAGFSGIGVRGQSTSYVGVEGISSGSISQAAAGVTGSCPNGYGVRGTGGTYGVSGTSGAGTGVTGSSTSGIGVSAGTNASDQPAMYAKNVGGGTALLGFVGGFSADPPSATIPAGVFGYANADTASRGVVGKSPLGQGIHGESSSGTGVYGSASTGYALHTSGRIKADRVSGLATIPAGRTTVTLAPGVNVTASSFVLLTPKANIGARSLWFTTDAVHNKIAIHLSSTRTVSTRVAWLLLG